MYAVFQHYMDECGGNNAQARARVLHIFESVSSYSVDKQGVEHCRKKDIWAAFRLHATGVLGLSFQKGRQQKAVARAAMQELGARAGGSLAAPSLR